MTDPGVKEERYDHARARTLPEAVDEIHIRLRARSSALCPWPLRTITQRDGKAHDDAGCDGARPYAQCLTMRHRIWPNDAQDGEARAKLHCVGQGVGHGGDQSWLCRYAGCYILVQYIL